MIKVKAKGGRSPKRKGDNWEREAVKLLAEHGFAAHRVPLSGAIKGCDKFDHDVTCPVRGADRRIECKIGGRFRGIDRMLGDNYALLVRDDRGRPLVVQTLASWSELAK